MLNQILHGVLTRLRNEAGDWTDENYLQMQAVVDATTAQFVRLLTEAPEKLTEDALALSLKDNQVLANIEPTRYCTNSSSASC